MKKVKGGSVEVTVTDKGSLKELGKNARRAGEGMGSVAKNTAESDRRLKSLSNQTSNTTKAFSKQAQTISGGLVPIYATLAAQVFAISAAYRFLIESANFKNLLEGQLAYGALTGNMYSVLATDIREATKAQISFSEASQAAAIGSAAGLSGDQLERLGTAALNTSMALGRDLTDSFNRLVRGVTKAEPELLDELGIVLRLDPALRAYATAVGKTKDQLNPFERSQAVTNEVLEQAESKFGAISELMPESSFAVQQFGQAFVEVLEDVKVIIADVGAVVLPFFTQNVTALIGALSAFSLGIVKTMLPNFDAVAETARQKRRELQVELNAVKAEMATLQAGGAIKTKADARGIRKTAAADLQRFRPDLNAKKLSDRQVSALLAQAKRGRMKMTAEMKGNEAAYINSLERMAAANKRIQGKQVLDVQTAEQKKRLETLKTEQTVINSEEKRAKRSMALNKAVGMAFNALMIASVAVMAVDLIQSSIKRAVLGDDFEDYNKTLDALKSSTERLEQINEQLDNMEVNAKFATSAFTSMSNALRSVKLEEDALGIIGADQTAIDAYLRDQSVAAQLAITKANPLVALSMGMFPDLGDYFGTMFDFTGKSELGKQLIERQNEFMDQLDRLERMATPELADRIQAIRDAIKGDDETAVVKAIADFNDLREEYNKIVASAKGLTEAQKTLNASIVGFVGKFAPKDVGGNMRTALTATQQAAADTRKILEADIKDFGGMDALVFGDTGGFMGPTDPQREIDRQKLLDRLANLEDVEALNQAIDDVLAKHIDKRNEINLAESKNKLLASSILKDNSALSAQLTRQTKIATNQNKLDEHQLQMDITRDLIQDERLAGQADEVEKLTQALKLMEDQEKVLMNILRISQTTEFTRRQGLENLLRTRQETTGAFGVAHMFGLSKPITEQQITDTQEEFGLTRPEAIADLQKFNAHLAVTEMQMKLIEGLSVSIGTSLVDGLANAFVEVAKGTTTFADAFRNMTIQILADIAAMTMKMAIFKALAGMFATPHVPVSMDPITTGLQTNIDAMVNTAINASGRSGGIMSSPGYRSFARGGIAMGPDSGYAATLHGTEAVVPLGNSRSIPVELKGEGGGVNNITVNVNGGTEGGGQSPEQARALGQMIQVATMEIIQREKRPGGVLSK